jgi:hypothetical protein
LPPAAVETRQDLTARWWREERNKYELIASDVVEAECRKGDSEQVARRQALLEKIAILPPAESLIVLAEALVVPGGIPTTAAPDAVHVASAVIHRCDYLLTWNMRHIANARIRRVIEAIIERRGYVKPTICTPEEL